MTNDESQMTKEARRPKPSQIDPATLGGRSVNAIHHALDANALPQIGLGRLCVGNRLQEVGQTGRVASQPADG